MLNAARRHCPLAAGCLPGFLRGGLDGGVPGLVPDGFCPGEPLASSPGPPPEGGPPKGLSEDGGFEEFVEFLLTRSVSSTVIACNRQRSSRRSPAASPSKKTRFIAERSTGGLYGMPAKESDSRRLRQHLTKQRG